MSDVKRSVNFTYSEENILISLVKKYSHVIENKKTDSNVNKMKNEYWKRIEQEFNNESGVVFRDSLCLKKKYDNMKKRTKKKFSEEKCYALGTGGGPSKDIQLNEVDIEIKELLGERVAGRKSQYGGDKEQFSSFAEEEENIVLTPDLFNSSNYLIIEEPSEENASQIIMPESVNSQQETISIVVEEAKDDSPKNTNLKSVQNLRKRKSKVLDTGNCSKNNTPNFYEKVSQWAETKINSEEEKKKLLQEEQKKKMSSLEVLELKRIWSIEEQHKKQMEMLEEERLKRLEYLEKEHQVKMEMLKSHLKLQNDEEMRAIKERNNIKKNILLSQQHTY